jgi:hypothetical protein
MIERFYAAHIKSTLDASAINILKAKRTKPDKPRPTQNAHQTNLGSRSELPTVASGTFSIPRARPLRAASGGVQPRPSAEGHP